MDFEQHLELRAVDAETLADLRRRTLRNNDPNAVVRDERDTYPESIHLGGYLGHQLVVCASFYEGPPPFTSQMTAWHMRYVGVHPSFQRQGHGATLLRGAEDHLRALSVEQLWANARDSALGFYERLGWSQIPGSQHRSPPPMNMAHTVIYKVLSPRGFQS